MLNGDNFQRLDVAAAASASIRDIWCEWTDDHDELAQIRYPLSHAMHQLT